jgi:hypothetical protein
MEQAAVVPIVAFLCLVASVAMGMATHGRPGLRTALAAPPAMLHGIAVGLLSMAVLALLMLASTARSDFRRAEARAHLLARDATALDDALRATGPAGELARTTLYRYTDGIARLLYGSRKDLGQPSPAVIEALRLDLRQQVAGLGADPTIVATAVGRLEVMLRSGDDLLRMAPVPGLKWCRPILVALLMAGLGLLSLLTPPRVRSAILLTGLATVLSLGMFFLEEMAYPFHGSFTVSQAIFDEALFTIAN